MAMILWSFRIAIAFCSIALLRRGEWSSGGTGWGAGSSVGAGIRIGNEGAVSTTHLISGNTIQSIGTQGVQGSEAIQYNMGLVGSNTGGGTANLTIHNNVFRDIMNARGVVIQDNQQLGINNPGPGPFPTINLSLQGNQFLGTISGQAGNGQYVRLRELNGTFNVTQAQHTAAANPAELDDANGFNSTTLISTSTAIGGSITYGRPAPPTPITPVLSMEVEALPASETLPTDDGGNASGSDAGVSSGASVESGSGSSGEAIGHTGGSTSDAAPAAPVDSGPNIVDDGVISQVELDFIVDAAIQRWADAGATPEQIAAMRAVTVSVSDLGGLQLGTSGMGAITIDDNGGGWSWFIDSTPNDDGEFTGSGTLLTATDPKSQAGTRVDLLTVMMHELGHQIGLGHESDAGELMYGAISNGQRRLPGADDADQATGTSVSADLALAPIGIGTLPAGQSVTVQWRSTVDPVANQTISPYTQTTSVTGDNIVIAAGSDTTDTLHVDGMSLDIHFFNDADGDGVKDAGEAGIGQVAVELYADNGSVAGEWDSDDTLLQTSVSFGSTSGFSNIAPGDYVVAVKAGNFNAGKSLHGMISSPGESDPDDNVDGDDNGIPHINGTVVTKAITLAYNTETVDDGTGQLDINDTLDFGFMTVSEPEGADSTIAINEDAPHTFGAADFGFSDANGDTLVSVVITTLPGAGVLRFDNGTDPAFNLAAGAEVTVADLDAGYVTYVPPANQNGVSLTSFTFQVRDSNAVSNLDTTPNTITFDVTAVADAPTGLNDTLTLMEDGFRNLGTGNFNFSDADGDEFLSVTITNVTGGSLWRDANGGDHSDAVRVTDASVTYTLMDFAGGDKIFFRPDANSTAAGSLTFTLKDDSGAIGADTSAPRTLTFAITPVDDAAVAMADAFGIMETAQIVGGNLFADNGSGADTDPDDPLVITEVNGSAANVGTQIILASGALLTVNSNGTFDYNPNGALEYVPAAGSGASNLTGNDSFTYTLAGGNTATVTITATGIDNNDMLIGTSGTDILLGGLGSDQIFGLAGNDVINGAEGVDEMIGGLGNDRYFVNNAADAIVELVGEGDDLVSSSVSYALAAGVSVETLGTTNSNSMAAINLTGNAFAQSIYGNAGANVLNGGGDADYLVGFGGNDIYIVDNALDAIREVAGQGSDTVRTSVNYTLGAGVHVETFKTDSLIGTAALRLTGNELANMIVGNAGNNIIDGGSGIDTLSGQDGNDRYYVDNAADRVIEIQSNGDDTVFASVSYTLESGGVAWVEALRASNAASTTAINLTGNEVGQTIAGNAGANILNGLGGSDYLQGYAGDDRMIGGAGADYLLGGAGNDTFVYEALADSTAAVFDRILDFATGDLIDLSGIDANSAAAGNDSFTSIGSNAFGHVAGELRMQDNGNGSWLVEADVDGNGVADFALTVTGSTLTDSSFLF